MDEAAKNHRKIASNIRELVVNPFSRWCDEHSARILAAQDDLQIRIRAHDRQADAVRKLRSQYYNKCRLVEDLEEEDKLAFKDPQSEVAQSPKNKGKMPEVPTIQEPEVEEEVEQVEIGGQVYLPDQIKKILTHMLEIIKLGEAKVPILGTYQNVASGADITEYIQLHMGATSLAQAEKIGQDLVDNGFLRLVGNVGNTFANSSRLNYQFRPKVFHITGIPERKRQLDRVMSLGISDNTDSPVNTVSEYLSGWNPLNNPYPNETPAERLRREAHESDERYKLGVRKLDALRCNLEEAMVDRLKWMERCELDRLKAIKAVILDFSGAISNVIPSLQSTVDKMMLFQETVQPVGDLRYLLENYRTGMYVPRVQIYENYYNNVDGMVMRHI
jgi:DEP domain-containing protein